MKPRCPSCDLELPIGVVELRKPSLCPFCAREIAVLLYPAALRTVESAVGTHALPGDACCFFHPEKSAAAACGQCGRFVCGLCEITMTGEVWCPECLTSGVKKAKIGTLETSRTLWDSTALILATWPLVLVWPSILAAPAALFIAIRFWRRPTSPIRRWKWRAGLALIISVVTLGLWVLIIYQIANAPQAPAT